MKILTQWLRALLPSLSAPFAITDRQLADDLTLRGIAVEGVHDLGANAHGQLLGSLFEMDITTNRVDAMNHFGIAREAATIYKLPLPPLAATLPPSVDTDPPFPVRIDPTVQHLCGRFTARVLRGINVAESTGDVARFFDLLGQRRISGPVDASNFTLLGMGHPTHAFDLDRIKGGLIVRFARAGERLHLLDGTERALTADDLIIADHSRALSLAGIMGGLDSSITSATRNVLVEAAWFDPATIRRSARRHGLHTDASHRFERGADFNAAPLANDLVSALILRAGGRLAGPLLDLVVPEAAARTSLRPPLTLSTYEVQKQLGRTLDDTPGHSALTPELVTRVLTALGCTLQPTSPSSNAARSTLHARENTPADAVFSVSLPSWRLDLERPIDLIEEVARVFGYNRFQNTLPAPLPVLDRPAARAAAALRARLLALGFSESISSSFASAADSELFAAARQQPAALENPLSEEVANLRPSLVPGMLEMLAHNLNRGVSSVRLFEQGNRFTTAAESAESGIATVDEHLSLTLGLTLTGAQTTPLSSVADAPIFELKGVMESIAALVSSPSDVRQARTAAPDHLNASPATNAGAVSSLPSPSVMSSVASSSAPALTFTTAGTPPWLMAGRSALALLDGSPFARFGELSAAETVRRKLRQPVFLAEIDLDVLLARPFRQAIATELSRFQAVDRDFSFVFPDQTPWSAISAAIAALGLPDLRSVAPVEIFRDPRGKAVASGHYSLLLRTVFQSFSRTLTDDELAQSSTRLIEALTTLGGTHRG